MFDYKVRYQHYLRSEHWIQLRSKAWNTYGYRCFFHKDRTDGIEMHHVRYRDLLDCKVSDLIPLCRECHQNAHSGKSWLRATEKALDNYWIGRKHTEKKVKKSTGKLTRRQRREAVQGNKKLTKRQRKLKKLSSLAEQIRNDKNHYVILDSKVISTMCTGGAGLNRATAEFLGLTYPLSKGWKKRLTGKRILKSDYLKYAK